MDVVALIAAYNEEHCIENCIQHHAAHGVDVVLFDNESTDDTGTIARHYLGRGVRDVLTVQRGEFFELERLLGVKSAWVRNNPVDWVMHADADEIREPRTHETLCEAFLRVARQGYNAVNFLEFTFVPTAEEPVHEPDSYLETMRHYYHFGPAYPRQIKAWMPHRLPDFDITSSAGHLIDSEHLALCPEDFAMRHYIFLSRAHAERKYLTRKHPRSAIDKGWHSTRHQLTRESFVLPSCRSLCCIDDGPLDYTNPLTHHPVFGAPTPDPETT